ncbi:hypothetical protein BC829DRAFT_38478 [Chytridium lagenaria]|nr:hypothetical protein BC829DRAFT_38478 [Chytridium lagenaria]
MSSSVCASTHPPTASTTMTSTRMGGHQESTEAFSFQEISNPGALGSFCSSQTSTTTMSSSTVSSTVASSHTKLTANMSVNLKRRVDSHFVRWLCSESSARAFLVDELARLDEMAAQELLSAATTLQQVASTLDGSVPCSPLVPTVDEEMAEPEDIVLEGGSVDVVAEEGKEAGTAPTVVLASVDESTVVTTKALSITDDIPKDAQLLHPVPKTNTPPLSPLRAKRALSEKAYSITTFLSEDVSTETTSTTVKLGTSTLPIKECLSPEDDPSISIDYSAPNDTDTKMECSSTDQEKEKTHVVKKDSGIDLNVNEGAVSFIPPSSVLK